MFRHEQPISETRIFDHNTPQRDDEHPQPSSPRPVVDLKI